MNLLKEYENLKNIENQINKKCKNEITKRR